MKEFVSFLLGAGLCFGAGIPSQQTIHGDYIEARTADVFTGPCFANSEGGLVGELAVFGWKIDKGSWQGVNLDGLSVVAAIKAKSTLGDVYHPFYPVQSVLIELAGGQARNSAWRCADFACEKMGGDLLQNIVRVESQPISLTFQNNDLH